jgi:hypothetical protein
VVSAEAAGLAYLEFLVVVSPLAWLYLSPSPSQSQ